MGIVRYVAFGQAALKKWGKPPRRATTRVKEGQAVREAQQIVVVALLLVFAVVGCATPTNPEAWEKEYAARGEFARDRYDCMKEADALADSWWCSGYMCLVSRSPYPKYLRACMEARGWRLR